MKISFYIVLISFLALGSCKKLETPLTGTENMVPIYKMSGLINGEQTDFFVDNDSVFMNYGIEKHHNISSFYTVFENKDKETSIKFSITTAEKNYNLQQLPTEDRLINFLVHEAGTYKLGFDNPPPNPPIILYLENNQFISGNSITYNEYGIYDLEVKFKGHSNRTFVQTINHGFSEAESADFELYNTQDGIYYSCYNSANTHEWFLDGDKIGDEMNGLILTSTGIHTITHKETDPWGITKEFSHIFYVSQGKIKWKFNTDLENDISEHNNYDHIAITYTQNGIDYSSTHTNQNILKKFHIKNIEYFKENENNDVISLKFDAIFDVTLNSEDNQKLELKNFKGTCKYILQ